MKIRTVVAGLTALVILASVSFADEGHNGHGKMGAAGPASSEALRDVGIAIANMAMGCATECGLETFEPFSPAQPNHLWIKASDNYVWFLHFNKPRNFKTAKVVFVGDGVKGRFCSEDQPDEGMTGFVHFHRAETPVGAMGHGGKPGADGWWLRHVAVGKSEMKMKGMSIQFSPGLAMKFPPTPAPSCS
tara:strand:+ start:47 stop:613 length:567 start_codon:yes stop_codon:yes gene_type:complete